MGRNSKAKRDARRKQEDARRRAAAQSKAGGGEAFGFTVTPPSWEEPYVAGPDPVQVARNALSHAINHVGLKDHDVDLLAWLDTMRRDGVTGAPVGTAMHDIIADVLDPALRGGWGPEEITEAVDRFVGADARPLLAGVLLRARKRGVRTDAMFDQMVADLGEHREVRPSHEMDLVAAMRLVKLLLTLPKSEHIPLPKASSPRPKDDRAAAKLAQVRALLAKAEATDFPEEAETLSAKAQELISRYSLEHLLAHAGQERTSDVEHRRFWLDAPYIDAKANLVDNVARANGCRTVYSATLAMSTLVGTAFDLDAVEMLTTSLMAQAQTAMLAHGQAADAYGRSSTRSFRQSFLLSFAVHIGERLRRSVEETVEASGKSAALVPVLQAREEEVAAFTEQLFPNTVSKATRIRNMAGWAGGKAAAELANVDLHGHLTDRR